MPDRRVLLFDGHALTAHLWRGGHVTAEGRFPAGSVGLEALAGYLAAHPKSLYALLVDAAEEGFQLETVPFLQGRDRDALIKRRLSQYFFNTPYGLGMSLGREKQGRRDERLLFAALTNADALAPWLDVLRSAGVALTGIYSAPLVLATSASAFIGQAGQCILITLGAGGLRQTYYDAGIMRFSRLTQLTSRTPEAIADACATEAPKAHQYLVGQRQIKRGQTMPVIVAAHADLAGPVAARCRSTADLQFEFADLIGIAAGSGLKSSLTDSCADTLLVHRLLAKTPQQQFAPAAARRLYRLWQARFAIQAVSAALLAGGLMFGAHGAFDAGDLNARAAMLRQQATSDDQRYRRILDSLPKVALSPEHLRAAIAGFDQLDQRSGGFDRLLRHLGAALEQTPAIDLQHLDWGLAPVFDAKIGAGGTAAGSSTPAAPAAPGNGKAAQETWFLMDVEGALPPAMASDQRAMIDLLDRFATRLQTDTVRADIVKRPVDVESAKAFRSGASAADAGAPRFIIRLGMKVTS